MRVHSSINRLAVLPQTISESTTVQLDSASEWLERARGLLSEARAALASLQLQAERLLASQAAVEVRIDQMTDQLDDVTVLVRQAQQHATDLMMQVSQQSAACRLVGAGGWESRASDWGREVGWGGVSGDGFMGVRRAGEVGYESEYMGFAIGVSNNVSRDVCLHVHRRLQEAST